MPRSGPGPVTGLPSAMMLPRGRQREAGHRVEQGRLAAAGRPQQADELAARDLQVDVLERDQFAPVGLEHLVDAVDDDMALRSFQCSRPRCQRSR